jgi:hypothetical protein
MSTQAAPHLVRPAAQPAPPVPGAPALAALPPAVAVPAVDVVPAVGLGPAVPALLAPARPEGMPAPPGVPELPLGDGLCVDGPEQAATPARTPSNTNTPRWIERRMMLSELFPALSCVPHSRANAQRESRVFAD